ncbi:MAG: sugar phosphate isomerase/epimerase [Mucilaginibacter polytrichastri]|nr:sugar phosphate isomerase/epimerase [Mucilaginibacter polytrichastri]
MNLNRRDFLHTTSFTAASLMLTPFESFAQPLLVPAAPGFSLKILATNWGFDGSMDAFCGKAKSDGYDGIETVWPGDKQAQDAIFSAVKKHGLEVAFLCRGDGADFTPHFNTFKQLTSAAALQKTQKPLVINCHSGKDYFTEEQNNQFIEFTTRLSKESGVLICHETHRSRMLFAAHISRKFIEKHQELNLTLDISHWCNVHETLLEDQPETVALALSRTRHFHARVGHPEGPQVNDPRAPEWENVVKAHLAWWDVIVAEKKKSGTPLTVLTEFGPPDYMPTEPYTRKPLADQWAVNVYMMQLLRKRYA